MFLSLFILILTIIYSLLRARARGGECYTGERRTIFALATQRSLCDKNSHLFRRLTGAAKIILLIFLGGFNKYSHICVIECMFSILRIALFAR